MISTLKIYHWVTEDGLYPKFHDALENIFSILLKKFPDLPRAGFRQRLVAKCDRFETVATVNALFDYINKVMIR